MGLFDFFSTDDRAHGHTAEPRSAEELELSSMLEQASSAVPVRLALRYEGTVQGVGFRWTVQTAARARDLTGWVRNLDDGAVALEVQGLPQTIARLLDDIHEAFRSRSMIIPYRIELTRYRTIKTRSDETDFCVR